MGIKELPDEIALPTHAEQRMPVGTPISPSRSIPYI
jgi:hypothetical protein